MIIQKNDWYTEIFDTLEKGIISIRSEREYRSGGGECHYQTDKR